MSVQSSLAFVGTVQSLGQSPEPGVETDDRTALVQVERPLRAPEQVDLSSGSAVVVQLSPDLPPLTPGDSATFFANPLIYGNTLVVGEVARNEEPPRAGRVALGDAAAQGEQDAVLEHARDADAVVRAHVTALHAAPSNPAREHDPHYWVATLDVDLVARGDASEGELEVAYANSLDRRWRDWPKPKAGQAGMWILHRSEGEPARLAPFQLMHPEDLQPSAMIDALIGAAAPEETDES